MGIFKWIGRGLLMLLVLVALAYPAADWMRAPLDDAARAELIRTGKAHQFVRLPAGIVHVRVEGPADGPTVVLIHGGTVYGFQFDAWVQPLNTAGFRVIVPDRFGSGFSERPDVPYTKQFFLDQIAALLDALHVKEPVHIVGSSMGGAIVAAFAAQHPERLKSVTLVAPAGLRDEKPDESILTSPVIGDWTFRVLGAYILESRFESTPQNAALMIKFREQTRFRGFAESVLNWQRNYDIFSEPEDYDTLGRSGLPVLAVWGTADTTVPFAQSKSLMRRVPQTVVVPLEGEEHGTTHTNPELVLAAVIPFLKAGEAKSP